MVPKKIVWIMGYPPILNPKKMSKIEKEQRESATPTTGPRAKSGATHGAVNFWAGTELSASSNVGVCMAWQHCKTLDSQLILQ